MFPYILSFTISTLSVYGAQRYVKKSDLAQEEHKNLGFYFFSLLAILIPSILAGCRDYSIGTDVLTYGNYVFFSAAKNADLFSLMGKYVTEIDPGYLVLNWLIARFVSDVHWFYFFFEFLVLILFYKSLYDNREKIQLWLGWFCLLTLFYSDTLNALRQSLAMAIILCGSKYIFNKKFLKYLAVVLVATLCHNTAIICILFYFIAKLKSTVSRTALVIASIVVMLFYQNVILLLVQVGALTSKFLRYTSGAQISFLLNPFLIRLPVLLLILFFYKKYVNNDQWGHFLFLMLILDLVFSQIRSADAALYRVSLYFGVYKIIAYPKLVNALTGNGRHIVEFVLFLFLIILWYYQIVIAGNNQVYPYTSEILGIYV